jgi:hypothetical protein
MSDRQPESKRFKHILSESELQQNIASTTSKNSLAKANWAVKVFKEWLKNRQSQGIIEGLHVFKSFEQMSKSELDSQLRYFVFEARKCNGESYPANSLRDLFQGIGFYVTTVLRKDWRIFSDREFVSSRQSLNAAMISANRDNIRPQGDGPSAPISREAEERLWNIGILGTMTPKQLIRTLFFLTGKFFCLRGGSEHRNLQWGRDITLQQTELGEVVVYTNLHSKNNPGGLKHRSIKPKEVKAYPNKECPDQCFVNIYKLYASKRESINNEAYYLKPLEKYNEKWFANSPIGHNTLANMMKNMSESAGLEGRFVMISMI